jgi:pimeloyl-ACP methyl ester carboxylesterase
MPHFDFDSTSIYFEDHGSGFPVLLIAPGAMESTVEMWDNATINPLALYQDDFRLIAMDQRNAGRSFGPLEISDPWGEYARDQLALLDYLGIDQFHVMGCCIGGSFALKLIEQAPDRVAAAVLEQPVGIAGGNRPLYEQMWRSWGSRLSNRPDLTPDGIEQFGIQMWREDFVVSVSREFVQDCDTPLFVLPGTDRYHPQASGREVATLAPAGQVYEPWNDSQLHVTQAAEAIRTFLHSFTPAEWTGS